MYREKNMFVPLIRPSYYRYPPLFIFYYLSTLVT